MQAPSPAPFDGEAEVGSATSLARLAAAGGRSLARARVSQAPGRTGRKDLQGVAPREGTTVSPPRAGRQGSHPTAQPAPLTHGSQTPRRRNSGYRGSSLWGLLPAEMGTASCHRDGQCDHRGLGLAPSTLLPQLGPTLCWASPRVLLASPWQSRELSKSPLPSPWPQGWEGPLRGFVRVPTHQE